MATAQNILKIAAAQIGYKEGKNNENKFGAWYGLNFQPWCAIFCTWVFSQAGALGLLPGGKFAGCTTGMGRWKSAGRFNQTPSVGDLVFFNFDGTGPTISTHVGIVESVAATTITTIEGNASNGGGTDGVYRHTRPRNSTIRGYGHPAYTAAPAPAPAPAPAAKLSIDEIARQVIAGQWGNGDQRKKKLAAAGYDYSAVQARVNQIVTAPATPKPAAPAPTTYTVRPGDNLTVIGRKYGTTWQVLRDWNKAKYPTLAKNPNDIKPGWVLVVKK